MKTLPYPCISIEAESNQAEELSFHLEDLGALAIEWRDESTMTRSLSSKSEFIAGFASAENRDHALAELKKMALLDVTVRAVDVTDDGWSTRWQEFFTPVVLNRIQIVTPWMELPRQDLIPITIDPGQAFGTGGHATTKLVLRLLEQRSLISPLPPSILDVGTGSGVLAVAAVKLGAAHVTGIDVDLEAVTAATENATANGVGKQTSFRHCEAGDLDECFELVLANIELSIFKHCSAAIAARVSPGGRILISGILDNQVDEALALWSGFAVLNTVHEDGWAALELLREQ